jgi:hypothetical protein
MISSLMRKLGIPIAALVASGAILTASPASAAPKVCQLPQFGGDYICEYDWEDWSLPDDTYQVFVIGTDYAVWTRWQHPNGEMSKWTSLGGEIRHSKSPSDFFIDGCPPSKLQPHISIVGKNDSWYNNNRRTDGTWSGWTKGSTCR